METLSPSRSAPKSAPKEGNIQLGGFKLKDERGIGVKIYSIALIVLEIIVLLVKSMFSTLEAVYKIFVQPEEKNVKGEIALITGTGHGIGREIALQYAELGVEVVCIDINEQNNNQTVKEITEKGGKAHGFVCDVSQNECVIELANKIRATVGEVSILVNNAGIMPCHSFLTHREDEIKKLYELNVFSHFWMIKSFLPSMISRNHGHIVSISSMAGVVGIPNIVPYCGSKFAVRGYMEALHEEMRADQRGLQIKFTAIYPYIVDTGLCKKPRIRFPTLMKIVTPKEVATIVISSMRRDYSEVSIPSSLLYINNVCRSLPVKIAIYLKDFLDSGVDSHE